MVRNLLYYVYPKQGSMLALNLYLLCKYRDVFNGRRIIFAADVPGLVDMEHLGWMLNDTHNIKPYELVPVPDGSEVPDVKVFQAMLKKVQSVNPEEATFFAMSQEMNSVSREGYDVGLSSAKVEAMYHNNLKDVALVEEKLRHNPCAGSHNEELHAFKRYYGSSFWFNHKRMFIDGWEEFFIKCNGCPPCRNPEEYLSRRFNRHTRASFMGWAELSMLLDPPIKNWNPSSVSIVTTCMNRWDFLKNSLPTWLNRDFKEIIVVDWSSDIPVSGLLETWREGNTHVRVLRVDGEKVFNAGMARNHGVRCATGDYLLFIDSDMMLEEGNYAEFISMSKGRFYHGPHNIPPFGTSFVNREAFNSINGYTELYLSYGWEDNDLYNRLEAAGVKRCFFDDRMVKHIDHSDELRVVHRDQKGMSISAAVWANRDGEKWTVSHKQEEKPYIRQEFML